MSTTATSGKGCYSNVKSSLALHKEKGLPSAVSTTTTTR